MVRKRYNTIIRCLMAACAITALVGCNRYDRQENVPLDDALQAAMDESIENSDLLPRN
jgi:hypothetical protein